MGINELKRLKQLDEENSSLKKLVADLSLDKHMLQEVIAKNYKTCAQEGERLVEAYDVSKRRAYRLMQLY